MSWNAFHISCLQFSLLKKLQKDSWVLKTLEVSEEANITKMIDLMLLFFKWRNKIFWEIISVVILFLSWPFLLMCFCLSFLPYASCCLLDSVDFSACLSWLPVVFFHAHFCVSTFLLCFFSQPCYYLNWPGSYYLYYCLCMCLPPAPKYFPLLSSGFSSLFFSPCLSVLTFVLHIF